MRERTGDSEDEPFAEYNASERRAKEAAAAASREKSSKKKKIKHIRKAAHSALLTSTTDATQ